MKRLIRFLKARDRGVAAIECAGAVPVLLIFLAGVTNLGLIVFDAGRVNAAVGAGAEYAVVNVSSIVSNGASAQTTIHDLVQHASGLTGMNVTVTGLSPAACYCVSGTPPATTSATCTSTCSNGAPAGTYVFITATYTYSPILSSLIAPSPTITRSATVQVK